MKKSEWKHYAKMQAALAQSLLKEYALLQNAWAVDEHIQSDGSLRPSLSETIKRAEQLEKHVDNVEKELQNEIGNSFRFQTHLQKIAYFLKVEWDASDFPIEEVLEAIKDYNK